MTGFQRDFAAELVSTFGSLLGRRSRASLALGVLVDRWPKRATISTSHGIANQPLHHGSGGEQ